MLMIERHVAPQHQQVRAHLHSHTEQSGVPDAPAPASIVRARDEAHLDLDLTPHTLDDPKDLVVGQQQVPLVLLRGDRHQVGEDE